MVPSSFKEANQVFDKPETMSHEECQALDTFRGVTEDGLPVVISCWKCTKEELEEINKTGRVWCFLYGAGIQPHALSGQNPFKDQQ
jgi:hypothetical protein